MYMYSYAYLLIRVGFYNKTAADSLRASLAQITSDLSTYSLNESDTVRERDRDRETERQTVKRVNLSHEIISK